MFIRYWGKKKVIIAEIYQELAVQILRLGWKGSVEIFFRKPVEQYQSLLSHVPELDQLETDLTEVSELFPGSLENETRGVGFYLNN